VRPSAVAVLFVLVASCSYADTLYKYQDADGNWIFSDRPPPDGAEAEVRVLGSGDSGAAFAVAHAAVNDGLQFTASNDYHAPVEVMLRFDRLDGFQYAEGDQELRWTVPARSTRTLLTLVRRGGSRQADVQYYYEYVAGSPAASHAPARPYRTPFALAQSFPVTQAYPTAATHQAADSAYAVDFALPVGTDVFAAREGVVFAVESSNYRGGLDTSREGARANVVQILHADGTYAVYAHLNRSSIRVRPGDRVQRGEFIAESGNTGFSTGPHLHFVVLRNAGMRLESVPVTFEGQGGAAVAPSTGDVMTAY
jgi:murein DD-endopeptidase MepM/ murein hydrolase activator NlpD